MTSQFPALIRRTPAPLAPDDGAWAGDACPLAAGVCAFGFFLRLVLSQPVLNMMGIDYGGEDASAVAKIHPSSWFILLSFVLLIFSRANPVERIIGIARQHSAYFSFILIYLLILIYWLLRGPKGIGLILDVHIVMPICAIVFCYAPRNLCRRIVYLFAAIAVLNSLIGIAESLTHLRLFAFDPSWEVLNQDYFRASALMGHPLTNAGFTAVAMFVLLGLRMPGWLKAVIFLIMLSSLVAFGGRSSLGFSVAGLIVLGIVGVKRHFAAGRMTVMRLMMALLAILLVPLLCVGLLYGALHSGMGERLMAYNSLNDDSASVRLLAFQALDYMSPSDMIFGVDGDRIDALGLRAGVAGPTSDIENPWMLMFMFLGAIMFTLWIGGLGACVWRLMAGASPALQLAVIEYFCIASTSNSFGRKDPVYALMAGIVVCAKQLDRGEKRNS